MAGGIPHEPLYELGVHVRRRVRLGHRPVSDLRRKHRDRRQVGRSSAVLCDRTCEWVDTPARGVGHIRFVNGVRWLGDTALPGTILLTYS